jgi:hypothetical protein
VTCPDGHSQESAPTLQQPCPWKSFKFGLDLGVAGSRLRSILSLLSIPDGPGAIWDHPPSMSKAKRAKGAVPGGFLLLVRRVLQSLQTSHVATCCIVSCVRSTASTAQQCNAQGVCPGRVLRSQMEDASSVSDHEIMRCAGRKVALAQRQPPGRRQVLAQKDLLHQAGGDDGWQPVDWGLHARRVQ